MINASNVTVEGHDIFKNDYIILPYQLNYSKLVADEAIVKEFCHYYPFLSRELISSLLNKDIVKIPKYPIISKAIMNLGEDTKSKVTDAKVKAAIDKRTDLFLNEFYQLYMPHISLLSSRIIRLNSLTDMGVPSMVKTTEERLCAKESLLMLALVMTCAPTVNIENCFSHENVKIASDR